VCEGYLSGVIVFFKEKYRYKAAQIDLITITKAEEAILSPQPTIPFYTYPKQILTYQATNA
jgi:hypothetical protein